ncbi:recombination-associated protein RdgC [Alkalisalibacterium limincola]|uniref:Recombination-associated protein RdgC n=1 Tax=Alkalisalibacterium limincola TaxID=2699169 RepID=A0A5C8KR64_9GAMM|nr:recombination-associated protein RdgC [Alkalisalibacterium limincola]TXK62241.1 recombination-associated protein RdgC [Alkalisalibacterium limincola]
MFFRNLTFFRFPVSMKAALAELEARLDECRLKPVGQLEMSSRGFVAPMGREAEALVHGVGDCRWVTLGGEDKILPAAVVNDMVARRAEEMEERDGSKLGGRARKRLKDEILHELLPKAFVRPVRTNATLDLEHGFIAVDSSSRKSAENLVSEVRHALGSFPALPLNAEVAPRSILTSWLAGEKLPEGLELGEECELKDGLDKGAVVRCTRQELDADEIAKHLEAGKQCTKLALVLEGQISFVIGEDLIVRKLKFLDGAVEGLEGTDHDSVHAELDARYALMSGELKRLFVLLEKAFKLSRPEA